LLLKDSERRPDPEPARVDERIPVLVGLALWVVALVVLLLVPSWWEGREWVLWTTVAGIALGLVGILYTQLRRRQPPHPAEGAPGR